MSCGNRIRRLLLIISFNAICFISFSRSSFFSEFLVKERLNVTATAVLGNSRGDIRLVAGSSDIKSECFWSEQVVYEHYEKSVPFYSDFHLRISKCSINISSSSLTTSLWGDHFVIEGSEFYGSQVCCWLWNSIYDSHNLPQVEQMYCCCVWKYQQFEMQWCLCHSYVGSPFLLTCSTVPCSPVPVSQCPLSSAHTCFVSEVHLVPYFLEKAWHRCMLFRLFLCSS